MHERATLRSLVDNGGVGTRRSLRSRTVPHATASVPRQQNKTWEERLPRRKTLLAALAAGVAVITVAGIEMSASREGSPESRSPSVGVPSSPQTVGASADSAQSELPSRQASAGTLDGNSLDGPPTLTIDAITVVRPHPTFLRVRLSGTYSALPGVRQIVAMAATSSAKGAPERNSNVVWLAAKAVEFGRDEWAAKIRVPDEAVWPLTVRVVYVEPSVPRSMADPGGVEWGRLFRQEVQRLRLVGPGGADGSSEPVEVTADPN